jgi:hypothetical protein
MLSSSLNAEDNTVNEPVTAYQDYRTNQSTTDSEEKTSFLRTADKFAYQFGVTDRRRKLAYPQNEY